MVIQLTKLYNNTPPGCFPSPNLNGKKLIEVNFDNVTEFYPFSFSHIQGAIIIFVNESDIYVKESVDEIKEKLKMMNKKDKFSQKTEFFETIGGEIHITDEERWFSFKPKSDIMVKEIAKFLELLSIDVREDIFEKVKDTKFARHFELKK